MKIHRLTWTPYRVPFRQPFATAHGTQTGRHGFLLRLVSDTGQVGLGEAAPIPGNDPRAWADAAALLETLLPLLPGRRLEDVPDALHAVSQPNPAALASVRCGLDTATCDLLAQAAGVPLGLWLTGKAHETVPVNATVALPDTPAAANAAAAARASGFPCVKLKVGMAGGVEAERDRVAAVRKAVGDRLKLRLDANGAWNVDEAIRTIQALEPYDLELVEQPVACGNVEGLRQVGEAVGTPIAADEEISSPAAADRVLHAGAARVLVIKPMVVGGLRPARRIMERAHAQGVTCVVTTTLDSGVGIAAALHLAATLPSPGMACGLATGSLLTSDLLATPLAVQEGRMRRPRGSGLGVRLDEEALERHSRPL